MDARKTRKRLALAITAALLVPGMAFAGDAKEKELEARIAQLEAQVQVLLAAQQQQQATLTQTQTALDEVRVAQAAPAADKPKIQSSPILTAGNPDGRFSFGGFIKLDAMYTDTTDGEIADGSAGRMFYLPSAIPVGGADESGGDIDTTAQFSRFWFAADGEVQGHKTRAYLEFDLFGGGMANLGNQASTNTHGLTLRQAYVSWTQPNGAQWLAGQAWSNFQDVAALPDAVDFIGPTEGSIFVRQAQIRYSKGPWSFSIENPETTVTPYHGVGARISSDDNLMPDITARWQKKGDWGHVSVAGMVRQFAYENPASGIDDSSVGGALSVSGKFNLGKNDDIRYMASYGRGLGRYLGLGVASDTVIDARGNLEAIDGYGGFAAWRHAFSPKLRSTVSSSCR